MIVKVRTEAKGRVDDGAKRHYRAFRNAGQESIEAREL
jgi:hypothetical protein